MLPKNSYASGRKVIFHGVKRTFHGAKRIFHGVKRTFRGGEYNSDSISSIIYNGYLNNFSIANRSLL